MVFEQPHRRVCLKRGVAIPAAEPAWKIIFPFVVNAEPATVPYENIVKLSKSRVSATARFEGKLSHRRGGHCRCELLESRLDELIVKRLVGHLEAGQS